MSEEIIFLNEKKASFWSAIALLVLTLIILGINVSEPVFFLFSLFLILIVMLFWDLPWIPVSIAIASFPLGNVVPIVLGKHFVIDVSLSEILIVITATILLLQTVAGRHYPMWKKLWADIVFKLLLLYVCLSVISFVHIVDTKLFFFQSRVIIFGVLTYVITRIVFDNQEKMRWFFSGLSCALLLLAFQVLLLLVENGYSLALFYDRNHLLLPIGAIAFVSALLAVMLPTLLGYFLSETSSALRLLVGSTIVLGFTALLLMLSKAAIGSFFLGMLYIVWKMRKKFLIPIVSVFGGVVLILFFVSPFLTKLIERSLRAFVDVNSQYRILEYKLAGTILHDHWFLGVGTGQQPIYFQKIYYADFINLVNNYLLQGWLDLGVAGFVILIALTVVVGRRALSLVKESSLFPWTPLAVGLTGSFVVAFFNGFAEVTFFGMFYALLFATLLGIMQNLKSWKRSQ